MRKSKPCKLARRAYRAARYAKRTAGALWRAVPRPVIRHHGSATQ